MLSIMDFTWAIVFDCACGLTLKLRLWVSNWFWLLVVAFDLAMVLVVRFIVPLALQFPFIASVVVLALYAIVPLYLVLPSLLS